MEEMEEEHNKYTPYAIKDATIEIETGDHNILILGY